MLSQLESRSAATELAVEVATRYGMDVAGYSGAESSLIHGPGKAGKLAFFFIPL